MWADRAKTLLETATVSKECAAAVGIHLGTENLAIEVGPFGAPE
jgi:hypothetical protein